MTDSNLEIAWFSTLLSLLPVIVVIATPFTKYYIVLSFIGRGMGTPGLPGTQVTAIVALGMALIVSKGFINDLNELVQTDQGANGISLQETMKVAETFLLKRRAIQGVDSFKGLSERAIGNEDNRLVVMALEVLIADILQAYKIGLMIVIPFVVVDLLVAIILMALGMIMMPPVMISLPFKIGLFLAVDGWGYIAERLITADLSL